jgi:hypothetical protein
MSTSKSGLLESSDHFYDEEEESFLLQWNNHNFSMSDSFANLRERQEFVDVTLVAGSNVDSDVDNVDESDQEDEEGFAERQSRTFGAHKVILSAW